MGLLDDDISHVANRTCSSSDAVRMMTSMLVMIVLPSNSLHDWAGYGVHWQALTKLCNVDGRQDEDAFITGLLMILHVFPKDTPYAVGN